MDYKEVIFQFDSQQVFVADLLSDKLGTIGFESFVQDNGILSAYCPQNMFSENKLQHLLAQFNYKVQLKTINHIVEQNWNREWEQNSFKSFSIDNRCLIYNPKQEPNNKYEYTIKIDPIQSFGTGYHSTTSLIISEMMKTDFRQKSVLDMGCGTGVLAILAKKLGASFVTAIDIDKNAFKNTLHNLRLNNIDDIQVLLGDSDLLKDKKFDIIIANINRNILIADMIKYQASLNKNGLMFFSGFFVEDIPLVQQKAEQTGCIKKYEIYKNQWAVVCFQNKM